MLLSIWYSYFWLPGSPAKLWSTTVLLYPLNLSPCKAVFLSLRVAELKSCFDLDSV